MDYVLEGYVREGEGDIEGAMDIYSRGLGNYPDEPALLNNFGVTCWNAGQKQRAVSILQKLVSIEPEFAIGRFNLGTAFTGTGELDAGIGELKAARELDRMVLRIKEPYREILKSLSRQYNVPLVNAHEKFEHLFLERGSDGFLFNDFCHPSSTGHKIIAEMIKAQIH
jgi:tetratricopeptide (TPR) repeat protein